MLPVVEELMAACTTTLRGVAEALNRRGTPARRGGTPAEFPALVVVVELLFGHVDAIYTQRWPG